LTKVYECELTSTNFSEYKSSNEAFIMMVSPDESNKVFKRFHTLSYSILIIMPSSHKLTNNIEVTH